MKRNLTAPKLHNIECIQCALKQVVDTTELAGLSREERIPIMFRAIEHVNAADHDVNNAVLINECYRIATAAIGVEDPYAGEKEMFNRGMMRLWPDVRRLIRESADPLRTAILAAIAGNLIDLAALGNEVTLDAATRKIYDVVSGGFTVDACDSLKASLEKAKTVLVLGDNCGEIAMDRLLIETILQLYPDVTVQYGVRGAPSVNDVTRADADMVGMGEIAEIIDNGDDVLSTILPRCSEEFIERFFAADVVIGKGMGNYEGLLDCDRDDVWFLLMVKCKVVAGLSGSPIGSILCLKK